MQERGGKVTVADVYKRITPEQIDELKVLTYNFILFNDVVCNTIMGMADTIKNCGMYVQEIKMLVKNIDKHRKAYEQKMNYVMKGVLDVYFNINQDYEDKFVNDFEMLRIAIKQQLDNNSVKQSEALSIIKMTEIVTRLANEQYKANVDTIYRKGILPTYICLDYLDISDIRVAVERLSSRFPEAEVYSTNIGALIRSIKNRLNDGDLVLNILKRFDRNESQTSGAEC